MESEQKFNYRRYNSDQRKAIEIYKWEMSERAGCDMGNDCISLWITQYAKLFRKLAKATGEYNRKYPLLDMVAYWTALFHELEIYAWIESEKAGRDVSNVANEKCVSDHINKYYNKHKNY